MALPKIAVPTFILTLPSSGNVIEFRPFLVKEEKLLLIASESKDNAQMLRAMISVIDACVITEGFRVSVFKSSREVCWRKGENVLSPFSGCEYGWRSL